MVRIDKLLWGLRLFKTRNLAATACKNSKILINNVTAKSSKTVVQGDKIGVLRGSVLREYEILHTTSRRLSASMVQDYLKDVTTEAELKKIERIKNDPFYNMERIFKKPDKKERRELLKLKKRNLSDY